MERKIIFPGKQQVTLENYELDEVSGTKIRVKTLYSLMSTGTENIVFNRLFEKGTHWDTWVKYPFTPGYSLIGRVEEIGPDVTTLRPADLVTLRWGHGSGYVCDESSCTPVPATIDPKQGAWYALAKIAFMGSLAAQYTLGSRVLIVGAGPVGQMSVRWAAAAGAESIIVCDSAVNRLALAQSGGATGIIGNPVAEAAEILDSMEGGVRPDVVIDTTGNEKVFAQSLRLVRTFGRVVILGDTGYPSLQHITEDIIDRGVTVVGAHDCHVTEKWNDASIFRLFFKLLESGRINMGGMISHVFKPEECENAYQTANRNRSETMGILFDWN